MHFKVKTQAFEGPLDLLLDLIERKKLFINDISLAQVTDDFIAHVKQFENLPMDESAHFILVASTLLLIKSKSLLPQLSLSEEEQGDIRDLEIRLKIYKRVKEASRHIEKMFGENIIFSPVKGREVQPVFLASTDYTLEKISKCLRDLLSRLPKNENLPKAVVKKVISIEEMIGTLTNRITAQLRMSFNDFTKEHRENRVNVIVSFLAMLELVKQGLLHVSQANNFADIHMETKDVGLPHY